MRPIYLVYCTLTLIPIVKWNFSASVSQSYVFDNIKEILVISKNSRGTSKPFYMGRILNYKNLEYAVIWVYLMVIFFLSTSFSKKFKEFPTFVMRLIIRSKRVIGQKDYFDSFKYIYRVVYPIKWHLLRG